VLAHLHAPIRGLIRRAFRVRPGTRERAEAGIREVFAQADAQRAGSPYLVGDRFTAADLTFAALAAPLVAPPGYGVELPPVEQLPSDFRGALGAWRATPSGAAALAIYERHR
jgi:glutathione S-transferase